VGDPLDIKMFEATDFQLIENEDRTYVNSFQASFEILKRFEF